MIHVLATININPGKRDEFVNIFKANVPNVLAEDGCIRYEPTIDFPSGFDRQPPLRGNTVVIIEAWESIDHLKAHLAAPHMATYREQVKDLVAGSELQILQPA